jgi:hypothetical protein
MNCGRGARWWTEAHGEKESFLVSGSLPYTSCNNTGKEAGLYLAYIIQHYDSLPERLIFCQADFGVSVFLGFRPKTEWADILADTIREIDTTSEPIGSLGNFLDILPRHIIPFPEPNRVFKAILPQDVNKRPQYTVSGHAGAQFWVDRSLIRKFPRSYYEQVRNLGGSLAHDLEFQWPALFQPEVTPPPELVGEPNP